MAGTVGLEPTNTWVTATPCTIEAHPNKMVESAGFEPTVVPRTRPGYSLLPYRSANSQLVVDHRIELCRCANLALSRVYKSRLHPVLSTSNLVFPQGFEP